MRLDWRTEGSHVRVVIEDDGIGLPASDGLFVPFFTTKPDGSGIGLSLARLIVEAHAGSVELAPRAGAQGAVAVVRLPRLERPLSDATVRNRTVAAIETAQGDAK